MSKNWVIARKPDSAVPAVGRLYEIRDSRKGTFIGRIVDVNGNIARVEVVSGEIHWASRENRIFNASPDLVNICARLVYLIEVDADIWKEGRWSSPFPCCDQENEVI